MKLLTHIDAAVLGWFQGTVDYLQHQPVKLGRVCAAGVVAGHLGIWWFLPPAGIGLVFEVIALVALLLATLSERVFALVGAFVCIRLGYLAMLGAALASAPFRDPAPHRGFALFCVVCLVSFAYFAACRPPRPRPPRRAASLAGGAA